MNTDFESIDDFAERAVNEIAKFTFDVTLSSDKLLADEYIIPALTWDSVKYIDGDLNKVPADKRGIYAFAVCQESHVLPPHGYILYVGIAGKNSDRSLRDRYKDYHNAKKILKRSRIARMIGTWRQVLRFFFAPVDDTVSPEDLKALEEQINTTLMPPFSVGDLEAETKRMRRAF